MLESALRANAATLHKLYDYMPHSVQSFLTSLRGMVLVKNRYSRDARTHLNELRTHESWDLQQIEEFQRSALQSIVNHARRTVPFYSTYSPLTLKSPADIAEYPVLSRDVVRANSEQFVCHELHDNDSIRVGTTGTTGASLRVTYSEGVARKNWAFHMRRWAWARVRPRTPRVTFFGSRVIPPERSEPPFWTQNFLERQTLASIFHISESNAPHYINFLLQQRGRVLEGFPSVLAIIADFVLRAGKTIPMKAIFTDGEPLYPQLRDSMQRAFSARVFDLYGNTELCGLIHECEQGRMHVAPDYAYLEILDEQNRPVAPGEEGYFVWTGFVNDSMPLIRYRIGDRGCWDTQRTCACGRAFPLVVPTITRDSDLLRCPDGRIFSPRALNQALKGARSLRFCQLLHEQPGHVVIRAVSSDKLAIEDVMTIRKNLQSILGKQISVSATFADSPIIRPGGKIPLIIQPKPSSEETTNTRSVSPDRSFVVQ